MRNTFYSWIALTLLYPQHATIYINTNSITSVVHNMSTERSAGTVVSMGAVRVNVEETPEEILRLIEAAKQQK